MRSSSMTSIAVALLTLSCLGAAGGPIEEADAAIKKRDYVTAVRIVRPMAERGDANAQYILGMFYDNGFAVPQDRIKAFMWLSLAASQGRENAAIVRDLAARLMTPKQLDEAKTLVRDWKPERNKER